MSKILTSQNGALWIQPGGPNTETFFLGCHDVSDLTDPKGATSLLHCFTPDGKDFDVVGETSAPPDIVTMSITSLLYPQRDLLERVICPYTLYVLLRDCGSADVFNNYVRGQILTNVENTQRSFSGLAMRAEDTEATLAVDVEAWPPLLDLDRLDVARIVVEQARAMNDIVGNDNELCKSDCGADLDKGQDLGTVSDGGGAAPLAFADVEFSTDKGLNFIPDGFPFLTSFNAMAIQRFMVGRDTVRWLIGREGENTGQGMMAYYSETPSARHTHNLEFDATDTIVACGSAGAIDDLTAGAAFTAEAWIRADGYGEGNLGQIFNKQNAGDGWHLYLDSTAGLCGQIDAGAGPPLSESGLDEFTADGLWHHVAMTYTDALAATVDLWIDGIEVASYATQDGRGAAALDTDAAEILNIGNLDAVTATFEGGIGWGRLSNLARYAAPFVPFPMCEPPATDANTIVQWEFQEGIGVTITDTEANATGTAADGRWPVPDCPIWTQVNIGAGGAGEGPTRGGGIFALDARHIWMAGWDGMIMFSSDGGETWDYQDAGVIAATAYTQVHFADELHGMAVGAAGVVAYTENGGDTWAQVAVPVAAVLQCVHVLDANRAWVGVANGSLYYTTDAGATWTARVGWNVTVGVDITDIDFANDFQGIMSVNNGTPVGSLYYTADGGYTWDLLDTPDNDGLNAVWMAKSPNNRQLAYAVGEVEAAVTGLSVVLKVDIQ